MATSRKRERELARRRFERRRQQELARRAKTKKRNTVIGSVVGTLVVIAAIVGLIIGLSGGSKHKKPAASSVAPTASPSVSPSTSPSVSNQPAPKKCAKIAPNPPAKGQPKIPDVIGKDPTKLVIKDIKQGHGRAAKDGDSLQVTYIGVACSTGQVFDASYKHPTPPTFPVSPLGKAQVIEGWNKGLVGIRPGGVRELIIPGPLAYEDLPTSAPTFPKDTLIFLITAKSVKA